MPFILNYILYNKISFHVIFKFNKFMQINLYKNSVQHILTSNFSYYQDVRLNYNKVYPYS